MVENVLMFFIPTSKYFKLHIRSNRSVLTPRAFRSVQIFVEKFAETLVLCSHMAPFSVIIQFLQKNSETSRYISIALCSFLMSVALALTQCLYTFLYLTFYKFRPMQSQNHLLYSLHYQSEYLLVLNIYTHREH